MFEQQVLPYFIASAEFRRVLFVGCDWYTKNYERLFRGKEYVTVEVDPARRPFGASGTSWDRWPISAVTLDAGGSTSSCATVCSAGGSIRETSVRGRLLRALTRCAAAVRSWSAGTTFPNIGRSI